MDHSTSWPRLSISCKQDNTSIHFLVYPPELRNDVKVNQFSYADGKNSWYVFMTIDIDYIFMLPNSYSYWYFLCFILFDIDIMVKYYSWYVAARSAVDGSNVLWYSDSSF
jgi:hypothetical protein